MVTHYLRLEPAPELIVFRTRLGLTVLDLAREDEQSSATQTATRLVGEAVAAGDGYAARDVLAHDECRQRLTGAEERALSAAVQSSGLGSGALPAHLTADLLTAVETSEAAISRELPNSIRADDHDWLADGQSRVVDAAERDPGEDEEHRSLGGDAGGQQSGDRARLGEQVPAGVGCVDRDLVARAHAGDRRTNLGYSPDLTGAKEVRFCTGFAPQ